MSVIGKLATSLNRSDEKPNQQLAQEIISSKDKAAVKELITNLENKNNRLVWGAMTAIDTITELDRATAYKSLKQILAVADAGSVITKDHAVNILIKLVADKKYEQEAFKLLVKQLATAATNQLPMYAEKALPFITANLAPEFIKTLTKRLPEIAKETKRKRVEKVIRKLTK